MEDGDGWDHFEPDPRGLWGKQAQDAYPSGLTYVFFHGTFPRLRGFKFGFHPKRTTIDEEERTKNRLRTWQCPHQGA